MRHAHLLGAHEPLMHRLFPTLLAKMGEAYPELKEAEALITETLKLEEVAALVMSVANSLVVKAIKAALRKEEEVPSEFSFSFADLLEEGDDEDSVGATKLSEEEQEYYVGKVEEFITERKYKETSPASYAVAHIALNGKAKDMLHTIKNAQYFPKFQEAFANWMDSKEPDQRPLIERAVKRQNRYLQKAQAEYAKIIGQTASDEIVA